MINQAEVQVEMAASFSVNRQGSDDLRTECHTQSWRSYTAVRDVEGEAGDQRSGRGQKASHTREVNHRSFIECCGEAEHDNLATLQGKRKSLYTDTRGGEANYTLVSHMRLTQGEGNGLGQGVKDT